MLLQLEAWAKNGLTDEQIAANMGIAPKTLYRWKEQYCQICQSLKRGKEIVDIQVENAITQEKSRLLSKVIVNKPDKTSHLKVFCHFCHPKKYYRILQLQIVAFKNISKIGSELLGKTIVFETLLNSTKLNRFFVKFLISSTLVQHLFSTS